MKIGIMSLDLDLNLNKKSNMKKSILVIIILIIPSLNVMAGQTHSTGKVTRLYVQECCGTLAPEAHFNVENRNLSQYDCTNEDNFYAIPLNNDRGKAMYSLVLAAYKSGKSIEVWGLGECLQTRPIFEDVTAVGFLNPSQ